MGKEKMVEGPVCGELLSTGLVRLMEFRSILVDAMGRLINGIFTKAALEPAY